MSPLSGKTNKKCFQENKIITLHNVTHRDITLLYTKLVSRQPYGFYFSVVILFSESFEINGFRTKRVSISTSSGRPVWYSQIVGIRTKENWSTVICPLRWTVPLFNLRGFIQITIAWATISWEATFIGTKVSDQLLTYLIELFFLCGYSLLPTSLWEGIKKYLPLAFVSFRSLFKRLVTLLRGLNTPRNYIAKEHWKILKGHASITVRRLGFLDTLIWQIKSTLWSLITIWCGASIQYKNCNLQWCRPVASLVSVSSYLDESCELNPLPSVFLGIW